MPWGRVDDDFYDHPKVLALGGKKLPCVGLYFLVISCSNRYLTDGRVTLERLRMLGGTPAQADRLVAVGLFDQDGDCYLVHDFLARNKSRDQVQAEREQKAQAGRKGGLVRGRQLSQQAEGKQSAKHGAKQKASTLLQANGKQSVLSRRQAPGAKPPTRPDPSDSLNPQPRRAGLREDHDNPRATGDNPRAKGTSPRQLRDGSREIDRRALQRLGELLPKPEDADFIGGGE